MKNLVNQSLSALLAAFLCLAASSCEAAPPSGAAETSETPTVPDKAQTDETETIGIFLNLIIQTPDGTIYESADDGETWFSDGEPVEKPALSAFFIGGLPVPFSEGRKLYVCNDTETNLHYGEEYTLLREENGIWVNPVFADGHDIVFLQPLYTLPKRMRWRFDVPTEFYEPITGKYRYVKEFEEEGKSQNDESLYTVILEFPATSEEPPNSPDEPGEDQP